MIRINVVAEGYSELSFVKKALNNYYGGAPLFDSRCVLTSTDKKTDYEYRGGMKTYSKAKRDIEQWLVTDQQAYVTTMFDFFRLPPTFPGYEQARQISDHQKRVEFLEDELKKDILASHPEILECRFIPYIQLHEFESLLYTDIRVLEYDYLEPDEIRSIERLYEATKHIPPEAINHGAETAPSKRLSNILPYQKGEAPAEWLQVLTVGQVREKCPHFSDWLHKLENLPELH